MLTNRLMCVYKNSSLILMYRCVNLMTIVKAWGKNLQKIRNGPLKNFKKKIIILKKSTKQDKTATNVKKIPKQSQSLPRLSTSVC